MSELRLFFGVVSIEFRKIFFYRVNFWVSFFFDAIGKLAIAYFLWSAVFGHMKVETIGGYRFEELLLYYMLAFLVDIMTRAPAIKQDLLSREIYDGGLTRYLIYPVSVFQFKLAGVFTQVLVGVLQFAIGLIAFHFFIGIPGSIQISPASLAMGFLSILPATFVCFVIVYTIELISFWADNVWSLNVMFRFISGFFGGIFLPLELFGPGLQKVIQYLPFYSMVGFPIKAIMGRATWQEFFYNLNVCLFWSVVVFILLNVVWKRGIRQYSGVGA